MIRSLLAAALAAVVACPVAAANGDGAAQGYRSTITGIRPAVEGITAEVLGSDDRLLLRNDGGRDLLIHGYNGEPYLRFEGAAASSGTPTRPRRT